MAIGAWAQGMCATNPTSFQVIEEVGISGSKTLAERRDE